MITMRLNTGSFSRLSPIGQLLNSLLYQCAVPN